MKSLPSILVTLLGAFVCVSRASEVEPFGEMNVKPCVVFHRDAADMEREIIQQAGRLDGVDRKSGASTFTRKQWRPDFEPGSWMAKNGALLNFTVFEMSWMPPRPDPQLVSQGGKNVRPVHSQLWVVCASLKSNPKATIVRLEREWSYNANLHVPYTEIPLWRSTSSREGSYPSDVRWLHSLAPLDEFADLKGELVYSDDAIAALMHVPAK